MLCTGGNFHVGWSFNKGGGTACNETNSFSSNPLEFSYTCIESASTVLTIVVDWYSEWDLFIEKNIYSFICKMHRYFL